MANSAAGNSSEGNKTRPRGPHTTPGIQSLKKAARTLWRRPAAISVKYLAGTGRHAVVGTRRRGMAEGERAGQGGE
jgi:hypothetical protein